MTSTMSQGRYKRNSDNFFYYTSAVAETGDATLAAPTEPPAAAASIDVSTKQPHKTKSSSLRNKARKQRARIYWQTDPALTTLTDDVIAPADADATAAALQPAAPPLPKPRKSKRSLSIRVSKKYDNRQSELDDQDSKSRMCVIS